MAKLVFGMNVSLDGYVDHDKFAPGPALFRHWIQVVGGLAASIYGRRVYDLMQYWDEEQPDWGADEREFAKVWRRHPKYVVSRSLASVGPNASLVPGDAASAIRDLKAGLSGELAISGPQLAAGMRDLVDEYHLYFRPVVLGQGTPFFAGARPPLTPVSSDRIGEDTIRLIYRPAAG